MLYLQFVRLLSTVLLVLFVAVPLFAADLELTPLLDLRLRQEILDEVFHFAPEPDRNWIRLRTRAGGELEIGVHRFQLRLANEHRHYITPDQGFDWNEVIIDQGYWAWQIQESTRLTLGRQNIIWPGGFLMLEGHPLDGSRSIYHNALRVELSPSWGQFEAALIHNPKYDEFVLTGDEQIPLTDADESAGALRLVRDSWTANLIYKFEDDPDERLPDLTTVTGDLRYDGQVGESGNWHLDLASQYQDGTVRAAANNQVAEGNGWAFAGEAFARGSIGKDWTAELDAFWYSGLDSSLRPFRTPWGRWPKWSEMYIYTLIGESTPGRIHVAAWEDIAAAGMSLKRPILGQIELRLNARYLLAPAVGDARGFLSQAELELDMGRGFRGHLLWEMLLPGSYHDGRYGLPSLTSNIHFMRWEVSWAL